jgi:hypothetical protein
VAVDDRLSLPFTRRSSPLPVLYRRTLLLRRPRAVTLRVHLPHYGLLKTSSSSSSPHLILTVTKARSSFSHPSSNRSKSSPQTKLTAELAVRRLLCSNQFILVNRRQTDRQTETDRHIHIHTYIHTYIQERERERERERRLRCNIPPPHTHTSERERERNTHAQTKRDKRICTHTHTHIPRYNRHMIFRHRSHRRAGLWNNAVGMPRNAAGVRTSCIQAIKN